MEVKTLQKQLLAAIAMVLVALIALASATYAWFVSNNSVTATTTNISAQSNSAYLVIDTKTTSTSSTSSTTATDTDTVKLYPSQVVNGTATGTYMFESAYASAASAALEKASTRFTVDDGTAEKAAAAGYAHKDTFYIGTGTYDGVFSNLKVTNVSISAKDASKAELVGATRVLIVCGDYWCVWKNGAEVTEVAVLKSGGSATENKTLTAKYTDDTNKAIAAEVKKGTDVTVNVYVFYDGADGQVYSDNLADLADCGVTITFEATPAEYGKPSA